VFIRGEKLFGGCAIMSEPIPAHLRTTYGRCSCGARITQCHNAKKCVICAAVEREKREREDRRRFTIASVMIGGYAVCGGIDYGRQTPRYMDGKEVVEG
jgi:hypothetical protein